MKRTALIRRSSLRRGRPKPWVRPPEDKVDPADVPAIMALGCIAVLVGEPASLCWGDLEIEHVKKDLRMGKRAESEPGRMVAICKGHSEKGMKAGFQWNTHRDNRAKVRKWLDEH